MSKNHQQSDLLQQTEPENGTSANTDAKTQLHNTSTASSATTSGSSQTVVTQSGIMTVATSSSAATVTPVSAAVAEQKSQPKRLHVSNIPFRFREPDLRVMFGVSINFNFIHPNQSLKFEKFNYSKSTQLLIIENYFKFNFTQFVLFIFIIIRGNY